MIREWIGFAALAVFAAPAAAQEAHPAHAAQPAHMAHAAQGAHVGIDASAHQHAMQDDPLARYFFPPDLVMSNQRALALTDAQRDTVMSTVRYAQAVFGEMQMRMAGEMERLVELLRAPAVDQAAALSQLDRVLAHEHQIKRHHIAMLIRIRNTLTPEQRATLERMHGTDRR